VSYVKNIYASNQPGASTMTRENNLTPRTHVFVGVDEALERSIAR